MAVAPVGDAALLLLLLLLLVLRAPWRECAWRLALWRLADVRARSAMRPAKRAAWRWRFVLHLPRQLLPLSLSLPHHGRQLTRPRLAAAQAAAASAAA